MSQRLSQRLATRSTASHPKESNNASYDQPLTKTQKASRTRKANQAATNKRNEEIAYETRGESVQSVTKPTLIVNTYCDSEARLDAEGVG